MKNYSSNRAQRGKTAYRTPHRWAYEKVRRAAVDKSRSVRYRSRPVR